MAVQRRGQGPDLVLFHGGKGRGEDLVPDAEPASREICRHTLLVTMLASTASVTDEAIDIRASGVRHSRFNSRKVSAGGTLLEDLGKVTCRVRVLWGEKDDSPFRSADALIGQ